MCGILALILANPEGYSCAEQLHEALYTLQHRGQDACGLAICAARGRIYQCKGNGRAEAVFKDGARLPNLPGYMGVGHLRYPTAGTSANSEAQPIYVNSPYGITMVHNGNLINAPELREYLDLEAHRHINTDSDSELMLNIFADELNSLRKARINSQDLVMALAKMYTKCKGAWACAAMLAGYGIVGFRDSYGIRPLVLGKRKDPTATGHDEDYMLASETAALKQRGFEVVRDIMPGECVVLERHKEPAFYQVEPAKSYSPDIFEYVYFARPDSTIDGISVQLARDEMGLALAEAIKAQLTPEELDSIDAVIPIPETSVASGERVAIGLNKRFEHGFVKNRYIFRTFIESGQAKRESSVRRKLAPIDIKFAGRTVLLVDDSIVRGTTSREIVNLAKGAGAKKVFFASCAPRITHPHIYGIDLASPSELIAHHRDNAAIARHIGAEKVIFQSLDDLKAACARGATKSYAPKDFEMGVFCGEYCTPVDEGYFEHLEQMRGESKKMKVIDAARAAVANGHASHTQHLLVQQGGEARGEDVVPKSSGVSSSSSSSKKTGAEAEAAGSAAGSGHYGNGRDRARDGARESQPHDRMDISIHNFGDHE